MMEFHQNLQRQPQDELPFIILNGFGLCIDSAYASGPGGGP